MKEGFYHLHSPNETEPVLVHGYKCSDLNDQFVFGFNTYDGGGYLPLSDLTDDTKIIPVEVNELIVDCIKDHHGNLKCGCPDCEKSRLKHSGL